MSVYNSIVQNSKLPNFTNLADKKNLQKDEITELQNITPNSRGKDCVS